MLLPGVKAREMVDWLTPIIAASWRAVSGRFSASVVPPFARFPTVPPTFVGPPCLARSIASVSP